MGGPFLSAIVIAFLSLAGFSAGSLRIVKQGNEALVERFGRYKRTLKPGINFIIPLADSVVWEDSVQEQLLDIEPQPAFTQDNVSIFADAVVFWQIFDLARSYYAVKDVREAIRTLAITTLRSTLGKMELQQTYSSRQEINQQLLIPLDEKTEGWGVKVTAVEVQDIKPPESLQKALEQERAAESKKRAVITEAQATADSMAMFARVLSEEVIGPGNNKDVMKFLMAQRYVDANKEISQSNNSKIIFMDPKALTEATTALMQIIEDMNDGIEEPYEEVLSEAVEAAPVKSEDDSNDGAAIEVDNTEDS